MKIVSMRQVLGASWQGTGTCQPKMAYNKKLATRDQLFI